MSGPNGIGDFGLIDPGATPGFDTRRHLGHAARQASRYSDFVIVDADAHQNENESWSSIVPYIEDEVTRHLAASSMEMTAMVMSSGGTLANQSGAGRLLRYPGRPLEEVPLNVPRDVSLIRREMDSIGIDYQVIFPTRLLGLGMHPDTNMEVQLAWAYSRWMTEQIMPHDPRIKTMIYLPFNEPTACARFIKTFGERPGVVGFMVASTRYRPVHHNVYAPIYRMIEERGLPLGFHANYYASERMLEGMNRFLSVHAVGFVLHNLVHLTNLIVNGIPERFPALKVIWIESGLAWVPFLMQRLDNEYLMRTSEAPLLKRLPSEYMRENFFYTTQPMERTNLEALELTFKMINAETQLLFASDYPHWDFDLPSTIYDLTFLNEKQKRRILGENAGELFKLGPPFVKTARVASSVAAEEQGNG